MKILKVNTPNGQYGIPAILIAEDSANYYACEIDGYEKNSDEWLKEVMYAFNDDYEIIDWLLNNSDWENWKDFSKKLNDKIICTEEDFWTSSDQVKIIEIEIH